MTPEEEAHWRYTLESMTNYGHDNRYVAPWQQVPDEVHWLREEARYHCHLANAYHRMRAAWAGDPGLSLPIVFGEVSKPGE